MTIKRRKTDVVLHDEKTATTLIQEILSIFSSTDLGWEAKMFSDQITVGEKKMQVVGVLIRRKWAVVAPKNRFGKMVQHIALLLEPVITVGPVFENARIHCLPLDMKVGGKRCYDPDSTLWTLPFRKEVRELLQMLNSAFPEELKYRA